MKTRTKTLQLHDWMLSLGLTEKEERVYGLIYGYSQDGINRFKGTAKSIAEWLHCSERTAQRIVWSLENRGLIGHEVISWTNGREGGTMTEFWAIDPEDATAPEKKDKITWKRRGVTSRMSRGGYVTDVVTPLISSTRNKYISGGCGKNSARSRAKTTTTTGFLFENSEVNIPEALAEDPCFTEWWGKLLRKPKWSEKTAEALEIELARLDLLDDPIQAAWSCMKAIERNWATIKDPSQLFCDDQEAAMAWIDAEIERRKAA